jgi:multiple sugar transport system substrate-binding protein
MPPRLFQRGLVVLIGAALLGGGVGCQKEGSSTATPPPDAATNSEGPGPNTVELKVSWWGSPERDLRTTQAIRLFEAQNPGIKVSIEHYASTQGKGIVGTDYWPTLNKHAADGQLPDVMQHDYAYIEEWTARGLLQPLDAFVQDGGIDLSDVTAAVVDGGKVNGKVMAVSLGINTQSIVLDTNAFAAAGVALPGDDWTWNDLERIALAIHTKLGIWGFGAGLHNYTPGWKAVYLSKGQWVFSPDGKALGYMDDRPWVEHWEMILRLQAAGALPRRQEEPMTSNVEALPLAFGKAAMEFVHSNQLVSLWTAAGTARTLKALPLPRVAGGRSPVYLKPSQYFSMTRDCKHPREAAKLIDFFTNNVEANLILGGERGVPIAGKVVAALTPKLSKQALETFNLIERAKAYATALPPNDPVGWTKVLTEVFNPKVVESVMNLVWTPEMAMKVFRTEANELLAGRSLPDGGGVVPQTPDAGGDIAADRTSN